jgi:hypothetical protein
VNLCQLSVQTDETFGFGHCEDANQKGLSNFGSIVTRTALHFSMLEVAPSAKTVVTCSKARRLVQQFYSSCTVPKSVSCTEKHSPKSLLTLGFSEVPRWDHSNFSSFHHIEMVTYPMILYDIICMIIRLSAWYPNCKLLDYPSLSKTCSRLGSLSLSRQVPWITTVVYHPLEAADGGDGLEIRGSQRIDMPYLPSGNLT